MKIKQPVKLIYFILITVSLLLNATFTYAGNTRVITGLDGEKAEIPVHPEKIACFYHPAYDKIIMLSDSSRIALLPSKATPWARKFYPQLNNVPINSVPMVPDVERMLNLDIDLVFYPKGKINITKVARTGIPVLCPYNEGFIPSTMDEYTDEFKKQVMFFGDILGNDAIERAQKYCRYLEVITKRIASITSKIPEKSKPKVYYGKLSDLCATQGNNTIMRWYTELAGGLYLPKELKNYFAEVNLERIISWDPDIVLLGIYGSFDTVTNSKSIGILRAGKSGKVYKIPAGIFCWDMTSCETALLPLFLGKKFHPELFRDWDIVQEMKKFYSDIYKINVSEVDAKRILDGQPPL